MPQLCTDAMPLRALDHRPQLWHAHPQLLMDAMPLLRCITDREAINMGIFLFETLRLLNYWRSSEKVCARRGWGGASRGTHTAMLLAECAPMRVCVHHCVGVHSSFCLRSHFYMVQGFGHVRHHHA